MWKWNLQQFAGSLTVTVIKDVNDNWTAASASPSSSLAEDDVVTLTATPATGYEIDDIEVIAGGGKVYNDDGTLKLVMGAANATLFFKAKKSNLYKVVEETPVWVNGAKTVLKRNMKVIAGPNGAVIDVECSGTELTISADVIAALVKSGAIVKIEGTKFPPMPES